MSETGAWRGPPSSATAPGGSRPAVGGALDRRLDVLIRNYALTLNSPVALLCQLDRCRKPHIMSSWGIEGAPERIVGSRHHFRPGGGRGGFISRALAHGHPALERLHPDRDRGLIEATPGRVPLSHAAATPVRVAGRLGVGLIAGFSTQPRDLFLTLATADSYAGLMALCLQHPGSLAGLLEAARRDELTACRSADGIYDELYREINRCSRGGLPVSCCFIHLQGSMPVDDQDDRLYGDDLLAAVARLIIKGLRSSDTFGRLGKNDFLAILPQTDETAAGVLAARLRSLIGVADAAPLQDRLAASIGTAEWTPCTSAKQLVVRAEAAMRAAEAQNAGSIGASQAAAAPVTTSRASSLTFRSVVRS